MPKSNLFIDTNVLLNFYSFSDDDLQQLIDLIAAINEDGICVHLPQQVINELTRNRESKLKLATDQFNKEPLPTGVPRHMHSYSQYGEYVQAITQAKRLREQLVILALADASNQTLQTDSLLQQLFAKATQYPEDGDVFALALQRAQKGNPPGKAGSVGDQYNWETLLKEVPEGDLHIVSKDGDYASLFNKNRPHPSLETEWRGKKNSALHIYPELRSFLKRYRETLAQPAVVAPPPPPAPPHVSAFVPAEVEAVVTPVASPSVQPYVPAPPPAPPVPMPPAGQVAQVQNPLKDAAITYLEQSGSFSNTHSAIAQIDPFKPLLTRADAERLIEAAVQNNQIRWIATDSDVYGFFASLITEHSDIRPDLFDQAVEVFGLGPDPEDPNDD